jgi:hypothetical protein
MQPLLKDSELLSLEEVHQVLAQPKLLPETPILTVLFLREKWTMLSHVEVYHSVILHFCL